MQRTAMILVVLLVNSALAVEPWADPALHTTKGLILWLDAGWVDTFRARHPGEGGHYSWWRQWGGARERNVGWRIDYVLASPSAAERVTDAFIWPEVRGSDHAPVGVDVE